MKSILLKLFKKIWLWKSLVMIALLILLLHKIPAHFLLNTLHKANLFFLFIASIISVLMVIVRIYKWQRLLSCLYPKLLKNKISFSKASYSMLGGMALGLITPARAGELGRIAFLPTKIRISATGLFFVDRTIDLIAVLMLTLVGSLGLLSFWWKFFLYIILIFLAIGVLTWKIILPKFLNHILFPKKIHDILQKLILGLQELNILNLMENLFWGCILMVLDVISLYLLILAFEPISLQVVTFVFPLILLSTLIPITLSGIGVREGTAIYLLKQFSVNEAVAFNASLLLYIINSLFPGLFGAMLIRKINYSSSKDSE